MKIISSITELQHELGSFDKEQIALVPTMGCLHEGHVSLIEKAKRLADIVVVSIYVNPLQFGKHEDLDTYPRPFEDDAEACKQAGVDFIFHPENLYANGSPQVTLKVDDLSQHLCGASRQGHFDGMLTVVNILFNIVRPHLAVFGEKDFQQLSIIQRMVADLHMPIEIIGADIVREHDGLAKSSRNRYLNDVERQQAKEIAAALHIMQDAAEQGCDIQGVLSAGKEHLAQQKINLDYLEICDEQILQPITALSDKVTAHIFIAAFIGATRLIDNKPLFAKTTEETPCV